MIPDSLQKMIERLFDHFKDIPVASVPFSPEVRKMCEQNACGNYGKCWTCPPAVGAYDALLSQKAGFQRFVVVDKVYALEDSFDWEGMVQSARDFQSRILEIKKTIQKDCPEFAFLALGAGTCKICPRCTFPEREPCRNPDLAIISVEAFGIDVTKMMSDNGMAYNHGSQTVTYIGGLFHTIG